MKKIIQYKILTEDSPDILAKEINNCIKNAAFQPYGFPFVMKQSGREYVAQAIVKYEEE